MRDPHRLPRHPGRQAIDVALHRRGRLAVGRPLGVGEQVTAAAGEQPPVRGLLRVVVAPPAVDRARQPARRDRLGGQHLQPGGADPTGELRQQHLEPAVDGDDHDAGRDVPRSVAHPAGGYDREPPFARAAWPAVASRVASAIARAAGLIAASSGRNSPCPSGPR